jgi:hypothetical protein
VLLEKAVKTQKESDVFATHAIRNMYSDLASVKNKTPFLFIFSKKKKLITIM